MTTIFLLCEAVIAYSKTTIVNNKIGIQFNNRPLRKLNLPPDNVISRHEKSHSE